MKSRITRPAKSQIPSVAANPKIKDRIKFAGVQWKSSCFQCVMAAIIITSYPELKIKMESP